MTEAWSVAWIPADGGWGWGTCPAPPSGCGSKNIWKVHLHSINPESLYVTSTGCESTIDQAGIFLMLSSIHPPSDLYALQQGQATEELLLSASSLAGLQGRGEQTGTWTGVPGNQQPDPARPITRLHVAPSKSPINWSDCPVDWKRELWASVWCVCVYSAPWIAFLSQ